MTETLLHEMIHADNFQNLGYSSHGEEFKKVAKMIYIKSNGKYTFCSHTTDKKLNEVVSNYAKRKKTCSYGKKI